jgi:para-aminobenzoate synthetase component 1
MKIGSSLLVREIPFIDPFSAFAHWADEPFVVLLDGAAPNDPRCRYAYLAIEPFRLIETRGDASTVDGAPVSGNPFDILERELAAFRLPAGSAPVPFATGAVGFVGYEMGRHLEELPGRVDGHSDIPDLVMAFYDLVLAFDLMERRTWILSSGFPEAGAARHARAWERADAMAARLAVPAPKITSFDSGDGSWIPDLSRPAYEASVERILEHIRAGDIYQANMTTRHRLARPHRSSAPAIYQRLRVQCPAPFAAYLGYGADLSIASTSPERFLRLDATGHVETRPIKGTRSRGSTPDEDERQRRALETSAKDRAENLMIVDLMRNDLSRVAEVGSVRVPMLHEVESFATVHHLVSVVTAQLAPGIGPVGLLRACFPGGSITGAPKRRAMEIIDAVEASRRGPYCGMIAWIGFDGAMDSSIVIRTLTITPDWVIAQAGGGIVADSDPAAEYEEMMVKVRPLLRAVTDAAL